MNSRICLFAVTLALLAGCAPAPLLGVAASTSAAASRTAALAALHKVEPMGDAAFAALTDEQFAGLTPSQIAAITPQQLAGLSPTRLYALMVGQFPNFSPAQIRGLAPAWLTQIAPAQLATLSADQANAMTASQIAVLTPEQAAARATALARVEAETEVSRDSAAGPPIIVANYAQAITTFTDRVAVSANLQVFANAAAPVIAGAGPAVVSADGRSATVTRGTGNNIISDETAAAYLDQGNGYATGLGASQGNTFATGSGNSVVAGGREGTTIAGGTAASCWKHDPALTPAQEALAVEAGRKAKAEALALQDLATASWILKLLPYAVLPNQAQLVQVYQAAKAVYVQAQTDAANARQAMANAIPAPAGQLPAKAILDAVAGGATAPCN